MYTVGTSGSSSSVSVVLYHLLSLQDHLIQFLHAWLEPLTIHSAAALHVIQRVHAEFMDRKQLLHLADGQGRTQVLFVGQDEHRHPLVLRRAGDPVELHFGLLHPLQLGGVHHKHHPVRPPGVRLPQRTQLLLPTHIPNLEVYGSRRPHCHPDLLRVESLGGDGFHKLLQFEPVEQGGFAGRVEPNYHHMQGVEIRQKRRGRSHVSQLVPHDCSQRFTATQDRREATDS